MTTRIRTIWPALLAAVLVITGLWSLRDIGPATLPTPGSAASGWRLKIQFPDVLNLPDQAKVRLLGRDVGSLEGVRLTDKNAEATLRIQSDTRVPRAAVAELRQDTPLGDIYVALTPPNTTQSTAFFADGDLVPQSQTRAPVQMEQMLTSLADFLGSGSLSQLGNTFDRLNSSFPEDPALTKKIIGNLTTTVDAWSNDTKSLDTAVVSLVELTTKLAAQRDLVGAYLAPEAAPRWKTVIETGDIVAVFAALAPTFNNAAFLVPTLRETNTLVRAVLRPLLYFDRPAGSTRPDNIVNLRNLLRDTVIPYLSEGAKVNVVRLGLGDQMPSGEQADQAIKTLRMLGVVR
ncbi:Mammalian cell entry related domain protein OS=Tsukamurella paurometabola (strain ATCC 8368 / DSM / CCUG 35730 / CIP 100753 / JCM 10117 / KCTC 9821 / NBRC 16120 / NCIMB 702349 / NCTC 13040) OX=521096 GN=Tpau_4176 PE=4 SV=1 [Tsukamurella paurometabola]|uniref:Mammalian cell entry related domain protein n=1 Tax=Tsukamurella paurometabola (strain ATCC 8368 / DSM 20162 / CCUG 35730 / CIP 100753 / JCM 10117 / KCTC 9821 / NBRC 16120 / NCIMB 702349 / NCTC 13040) TaxID=521096 RepID=D5UP36_TSUPD|nr:MlaD family protein [Tsukamurella paurometabola]ADG80745.1 Mammalian cell entry related domain protein [Tsukamurella paurometabola DSM 20162]SUP40802.1 virulence factor Mce family protein [Tsukamurella paurometabola]